MPVAKLGFQENVYNVLWHGILTLMEFVKKLVIFVEHGKLVENANLVMEVMQQFKELAFKIQMHSDHHQIVSVLHGKIEFVSLVLKEHFSIQTEYVNQYRIIVPLGIIQMDYVLLVIMVMTQLKDNVHSLHQTMLKQLILDVDYGIGKIKNVFNVQTNGFSILKEHVYPFLIYVELMMLLELVLHAIKDMI